MIYSGGCMDSFENIVKVLLQEENFWVRQSEKVNLSKEEKRDTGKSSIPRPEIDLVALNYSRNEIVVLEVKSYLDSRGVVLSDVEAEYEEAQGKYKLFTCEKYRTIVFGRLKKDFVENGLANEDTRFKLGLAAGKVYQNKIAELSKYFETRGWFFWGPDKIAKRIRKLAKKGYEDDPMVMTTKILER
jgi:hypothetical protein